MTLAVHLSAYWLLLPLAIGLYFWVVPRPDERGGYLPDVAPFFRLAGAVAVFLLVLCILLAINLWIK